MARRKTIGIKKVLTRVVPRSVLDRLANEVGLGQRRRKIQPHALFWTLVLGFGAGRERTIAGLRRAFEITTGVSLVPSAFYDRLTPALAKFMKAVRCTCSLPLPSQHSSSGAYSRASATSS